MIRVDYAGPIKYQTRGRKEGKAYIALRLQPYKGSIPRVASRPYHRRVPWKFEAPDGPKWKTEQNLLRFWQDFHCCSEVVEAGGER